MGKACVRPAITATGKRQVTALSINLKKHLVDIYSIKKIKEYSIRMFEYRLMEIDLHFDYQAMCYLMHHIN